MRGMRKEFYDLYLSKIFPVLKKLETVRKNTLIKLIIIESIIASIVVILGYYVFFHNDKLSIIHSSDFQSFFCVISLVILIYVPYSCIIDFKHKLKERCFPLLKKLYGGIKWKYSDVSEDIIQKSRLFAKYNRIDFDDKFQGHYNDTQYSVSETSMEYVQGSGKNKTVYSVFDGVMILLPSNKTVKAHTIITSKNDRYINNVNPAGNANTTVLTIFIVSFVVPVAFIAYNTLSDTYMKNLIIIIMAAILTAFLSYVSAQNKKKKTFEKVELEDLNFDKRFSVQSQDQIEARYLVTPTFMERLSNLKTAFGTDKIKCAFFDDKILFAISTKKDLFELGSLFTPLTKGEMVEEFFKELSSIYEMIDYFKLDKKTGL